MRFKLLLCLGAMACLVRSGSCQKPNALVLTQTIRLPAVHRFNHMSVDTRSHRLFAAAPDDNTVEIVSLQSGKLWRSLPGERPAAVRYAPEFNQLYVSRGENVYVYDGDTFNVTAVINLHSRLDELQYDARAKQLYVGCMTDGKTGIAIIAIPEGKLVGKVPLPAAPQGIAVDHEGTRLFANIPDVDQVAVVDRRLKRLGTTWTVRRVRRITPIGLDEADHRLFLGGRQPARLVVLDSRTGEALAEVPIDGVADDLFWDSARHRIYISCGKGFIDVVEQQDPDHYTLLGHIPTSPGAATSTFAPELNLFSVGLPKRGDQPAEILVFKTGD